MNNKIAIQEINTLLAQRSGLPKKNTETFLRNFFEQITSSLAEEQYVKIKNFGTFKTIIVEERESINIKTGERINIDKHAKVSFTPDNFLKDLVNRPFSQFQSAALEESTTDMELQEAAERVDEEVKKNAAAQPQSDITEKAATMTQADDETSEEVIDSPAENLSAAAVPPPPPSQIAEIPCPPEIPTEEVSDNTAETPQTVVKDDAPEVTAEPQSRRKVGRIAAYIAGALLLLAIGYMCGRTSLSGGSEDAAVTTKTESAKASPAKTNDNPDALPAKAEAENAVAPAEQQAAAPAGELPHSPVAKGPKGRPMKIVGDLGSYELKKGDFLFRIASKVYGDADMGRYIIEYNNIDNPDIVPPGTVIKLPKLAESN